MAAIAPPAMQPSAQGFAKDVYYGLELAFGYLIGGLNYQMFGSRVLMWFGVALSVVALGTFAVMHCWDIANE